MEVELESGKSTKVPVIDIQLKPEEGQLSLEAIWKLSDFRRGETQQPDLFFRILLEVWRSEDDAGFTLREWSESVYRGVQEFSPEMVEGTLTFFSNPQQISTRIGLFTRFGVDYSKLPESGRLTPLRSALRELTRVVPRQDFEKSPDALLKLAQQIEHRRSIVAWRKDLVNNPPTEEERIQVEDMLSRLTLEVRGARLLATVFWFAILYRHTERKPQGAFKTLIKVFPDLRSLFAQ